MENSEWIFTWKDHLFVSHIHQHKLLLKWTPVGLKETSKPALYKEHFYNTNSPEQSNVDDPSSATSTSFDLDYGKDFKYLTCGFSFDPGCFNRVPVMVVLGSNSESQTARSKGSKTNICRIFSARNKVSNPGVLDLEVPTNFELVDLGTFDLTPKHKNVFVDQTPLVVNNFKIVSFFHMLYLDATSANLDVYSTTGISSYSLFNKDECSSAKQFRTLDVFYNNIRHETFLLFSYLDDIGVKKVACIKLQLDTYDSHSVRFSLRMSKSSTLLEFVPQKYLFPPDYSQLVTVTKIISLSSRQKSTSESIQYSSNLLIITNTGYLLIFVDGTLSSCFHIWNNLQEVCSLTEAEWDLAKFNFVTMKRGSIDRIAIQVNSACVLLDVQKEEVIKVWQSVLYISEVTNCQSPHPCLLMVINTDEDISVKLWNLLNDGESIHIFDSYNYKTNSSGMVELQSNLQRQISEESDNSQIPQFAVDAILVQKKKYETALREAKIELAAKEKFLVETMETLQNLETPERLFHHHDSQLIPLLDCSPEADEKKTCAKAQPSALRHIPPNIGTGDSYTPANRSRYDLPRVDKSKMGSKTSAPALITILGEPWKRTIESILVVGVLVKNIFDRPIIGTHIHLIPGRDCSFSTLECVSSEGHAALRNNGFSSSFPMPSSDAFVSMQPGSEKTLTCFVDTGQILSPEDVKFFLIVTLLVSAYDSSAKEKDSSLDRKQGTGDKLFNVNCGEVILSTQDVISATYSLEQIFGEQKMEPSDIAINMLALDCVQKATNYLIKSKISSVLCLESKLKSHPNFLSAGDCLIFMADHQLRLCRVKGLEQISKKEGKFKILTRRENQTVLFVKLLHSLLPDDVILIPDLAPPSLSLQRARNVLDKELQNRITEIKRELNKVTLDQAMEAPLFPESEKDHGLPSLSSPTFHSKKNMWSKSGPKDYSGSADGPASNIKSDMDNGNKLNEERKKFSKAKRRLNEKLGIDDNS
ncbi:hypothetical protein ElyMa_002746000 [Elysia marginata]|uniref:Uncharacterized protein n=1 Tax=Elysia marginata TaxID=1093978 RepID=A0AAV4HIM6_9GAST|nr:hypothetical protein ElyMa_002746000 [Elysia marginata]